jgi:hypothetical protein
MNTQAKVAQYSGPGGWSDPDLLIGPEVYVGGQSDQQARAQFSMWSLFPTNLLISQNVLGWSPYALETYSNAEAIAINQDPLGIPAQRIVGEDLQFPCHSAAGGALTVASCNAADINQQFSYSPATGAITSKGGKGVLASSGSADGAPVLLQAPVAGSKAQAWAWPASATGGTAINGATSKCLDVFNWAGPAVDTWTCNAGSNQALTLNADGTISEPNSQPGGKGGPKCLAFTEAPAGSCTNVWGRQLSGGAVALGFVNNGDSAAQVACDAACFAALNISKGTWSVRDVWAHQDLQPLQAPFSFQSSLNASGSASLYVLKQQ